jgi:PAS domain S-box-containing protein
MSVSSALMVKPTNKEIKLSVYDMLVSKTDVGGNIMFANSKFMDISGYKESELMGSPHSIVRHPDMPKAIFFMMFKRLKEGKSFLSVIKNMSKSGDYYWVTTDFSIQRDRDGKIISFMSFREAAPRAVVEEIEMLYSKMLDIEKSLDMDASLAYFDLFFENKETTYDAYIKELAKPKSFAAMFFSKLLYFFK